MLENLLFEQVDPVVIDIKLSRQSLNQALSEARRAKEKAKEEKTTSSVLNYRISGFTTPDYKEGGIMVKSEEKVREILRKAVIKQNQAQFVAYLASLEEALRGLNRQYFGTSIVLIKGPVKSDIRWVDFHYWRNPIPTQKKLKGLTTT